MLAVTGLRSTLVQALIPLLPEGEAVERIGMDTSTLNPVRGIPKAERFVLAAGLLPGKSLCDYSTEDFHKVSACNLINPIRLCEWILSTNPKARICLVGSESARNGSYDTYYAATKAGLHAYVQWRRVEAGQQLALVSPTIIRDSGMTQRRSDAHTVIANRPTCSASDVARVIYRLLYEMPIETAPSNFCHRVVGWSASPL